MGGPTGPICTNLQGDLSNCGGCGIQCGPGLSCSMGQCVALNCPQPLAVCQTPFGGACVDVQNDPRNCGICGFACGQGAICKSGQCAGPTFDAGVCAPNETFCPGGPYGPFCTFLGGDPNNCGGCGIQCGSGGSCVNGLCTAGDGGSCPPALTDCGGACNDLQNDPSNCGACGLACGFGASCVMGQCGAPDAGGGCAAFDTLCPGPMGPYCANLQADPNNCGGCQVACAPNQGCGMGVCMSCPAPSLTCRLPNGFTCADGQNDPNNCGGCGMVCMPGAACVMGHCM
jgi:hypothetical protein